MSERRRRVAAMAASHATRHPMKAAKHLGRLPESIEAAKAADDEYEVERLEALAEGYAHGLDTAVHSHGVGRCRRCGRALRNEVSRARKIGPECWDKEEAGE